MSLTTTFATSVTLIVWQFCYKVCVLVEAVHTLAQIKNMFDHPVSLTFEPTVFLIYDKFTATWCLKSKSGMLLCGWVICHSYYADINVVIKTLATTIFLPCEFNNWTQYC